MKGFIKSYSERHGYGFVANEEGDFFFHIKQCDCLPEAGDFVEFEVKVTEKGKKAANIRRSTNGK